jgi:hypothetical protein
VDRFTKDDVLNRPLLVVNKDIDRHRFSYQGNYPADQFWDGSDCYVPAIYKAQLYKVKKWIKFR